MNDVYKRKSFLELLFDKHCYNIFLDSSIVINNGELRPINPYCEFDNKIIYTKKIKTITNNKFLVEPEKTLNDILKNYWMVPVLDNNTVNKLTFGLCLLLLSINNIGVDALNLNSICYTECVQNQLIDNWIKSSSTTLEHIKTLLYIWYDELRYIEKDLLSVNIKPVRFLPFLYPLKIIYKKAGIHLFKDETVVRGIVVKDNSSFYIDIENSGQLASSNGESELEHIRRVSVDSLKKVCSNCDNLSEFEGQDFYFCYSYSNHMGHLSSSLFLKAVYSINTIQDRFLKYSLCNNISSRQYSLLLKCMKLYTSAFTQIARDNNLGLDINAQCYIRFLHFLIWSRITRKTQLDSFFEIIGRHQLADFSGIANDSSFKRSNKNALYIPKDSFVQSSVLSEIYIEDLRTVNTRDENNLYNYNLTMENGKYCVNNNTINEIGNCSEPPLN